MSFLYRRGGDRKLLALRPNAVPRASRGKSVPYSIMSKNEYSTRRAYFQFKIPSDFAGAWKFLKSSCICK